MVDSRPLLKGFIPTDAQLQILKDPSRRLLLSAANRFGKTTLGLLRVLYCARGNYPYLPVSSGDTYWVFCPSWKNFAEVHEQIFRKWCPPAWLLDYDGKKRRATIRREVGGTATIKWWTYGQDPRQLNEALPPHGCWMDDPLSTRRTRAHLAQVLARLVEDGWIWLTIMPAYCVAWWRDIYRAARSGDGDWRLHQGALATRDIDNRTDYGVGQPLVPHLTRDQIVDFACTYSLDQDVLAARIFGEMADSGRKSGVRQGDEVQDPCGLPSEKRKRRVATRPAT